MVDCNVDVLNTVGQFRRFGPLGPVYKVLGAVQYLDEFDAKMRIQIVETGEEVEHLYSHVMDDPREN